MKKVAYFVGCAANYIDPAIGKATVKVLEKNNLQPLFPQQTCCGMPQLRYGNSGAALRQAALNVRSLASLDCDIVTACTTCALNIKRDYPHLLQTPEAQEVSQRTYDICEYLALLHDQRILVLSLFPFTWSIMPPAISKPWGKGLLSAA